MLMQLYLAFALFFKGETSKIEENTPILFKSERGLILHSTSMSVSCLPEKLISA